MHIFSETLPIYISGRSFFSGFYLSDWDNTIDECIDRKARMVYENKGILRQRLESGLNSYSEIFWAIREVLEEHIDFEGVRKEIAKVFTERLDRKLFSGNPNMVLRFVGLLSPRDYSFNAHAINATIRIDVIQRIRNIMLQATPEHPEGTSGAAEYMHLKSMIEKKWIDLRPGYESGIEHWATIPIRLWPDTLLEMLLLAWFTFGFQASSEYERPPNEELEASIFYDMESFIGHTVNNILKNRIDDKTIACRALEALMQTDDIGD